MMETIETAPVMALRPQDIDNLVDELQDYHAIYSPLFQRREQREWSVDYLHGLLLDIPRKSVEPMVLVLKGADTNVIRAMQQFIGEGAWQDTLILRRHWHEVDVTLGDEDGVLTLDGSDFLKQGKASVGVKRQYCGDVGKRANCQAGVFLGYTSHLGYTLVDRRLYLPQDWVEDTAFAERRRKCGVPPDSRFQTKPELGWEMIRAVIDEQTLRCRWLTCDEAFGRDTAFLDRVAGSGLWYFAEVPHDTRVWQRRPRTALPAWSGHGRKPSRLHLGPGEPQAEVGSAVAETLPAGRWHRRTIKEGSKGPMVADFAALRVVAVRDGLPGPEVWLVCRRHVETGELKTYLCNAPAGTSLETLARLSGLRWPIETCFEQGKQYLGMGDYEVRSWRGWHHHMTLCILAHFFLVRQQQRLKKRSWLDRAASTSDVDGRAAQARIRCRLGA
jgi:SRSO17 transposase